METVIGWHLLVAVSIVIARSFSSQVMIVAALGWTAVTFFALHESWLVILQLATVWGTVGILSLLFGGRSGSNEQPVVSGRAEKMMRPSAEAELWPKAVKASPVVHAKASTIADKLGADKKLVPKEEISILSPVNSALSGFSETIAEFNKNLDINLVKIIINKDFILQLSQLRSSISAVLYCAELSKDLAITLGGLTPDLVKIFNDIFKKEVDETGSEKVEEKQKLTLFKLSLPNDENCILPLEAVKERIQKLEEILDFIEKIRTQIVRDSDLLKALDLAHPSAFINEPFLPYLSQQSSLLRLHLDDLKPSRKSPDVLPEARRIAVDILRGGQSQNAANANLNDTSVPKSKLNLGSSSYAAIWEKTANISVKDSHVADGFVRKQASTSPDINDVELVSRQLRIPHLVHFTRCENLQSILRHGLMSVVTCEDFGLSPIKNDLARYDGQPNGTSVSVAFPNYRMFWKYRQLFPRLRTHSQNSTMAASTQADMKMSARRSKRMATLRQSFIRPNMFSILWRFL